MVLGGSRHHSYLNEHGVKFGNFVGPIKLGKMFGQIYSKQRNTKCIIEH